MRLQWTWLSRQSSLLPRLRHLGVQQELNGGVCHSDRDQNGDMRFTVLATILFHMYKIETLEYLVWHWTKYDIYQYDLHIDSLVKNCSNSSALPTGITAVLH